MVSLPDEVEEKNDEGIYLHEYISLDNVLRRKVKLTENVFSFLRIGSKEIIADNEAIKINPNQFLIIKSGNCLMTETISTRNMKYESMLFFFSDTLLLEFMEKYGLFKKIKTKPQSYEVGDYDNYLEHFVQTLGLINNMDKKEKLQLLKLKFEELMLYLWQKNGQDFILSILGLQDNKRARLIHVVENNILQKLTIQDLAFLCNMSISSFKREFKQAYNLSPRKWFIEKRLEHAAFLLSSKDLRATEVYKIVGYENLSNFVQSFRLKYGITPKQYQLNI